jgi:hypothetical protein
MAIGSHSVRQCPLMGSLPCLRKERVAISKEAPLRDVRIFEGAGVVCRSDLVEGYDAAFAPNWRAVIVVQHRLRLEPKRETRRPNNRNPPTLDFK